MRDPFKGRIHVALNGRTVCGRDVAKVNTVTPRYAQHATCQRCIASLRAL